MKFNIQLHKIKTIDKIEGYWNNQDYINLLELFDFEDASSLPETELWDMLAMAISELEPPEAAEIVLTYKLSEDLNEGQIQNVSHEMLLDKIAEEYPEMHLHYPLFNINQLLYQAYNGKFPKTQASIIDIELSFKGTVEITKEIILRTVSDLLTEQSLLKRLFGEKLNSENEFTEAESIIWELKSTGENTYQLIASDYLLNREDFEKEEFSGELREEEIDHRE